jgi:hypothetical protein
MDQLGFITRDEIIDRWFLQHPNVIPPMTDSLGKYWDQPKTSSIEIDDTYALMSRATFERLKEYSCTKPTGCYPGKMWKRHDGAFDPDFLASGGTPEWLLCWYGLSEKGPDWCTTQMRQILFTD